MILANIISLAGLVVLLALSAFFSGSETALFALGKLRIRRMKNAGNAHAELIEKMLGRPTKLLISILVGNMFVNIMASSLATVLFVSLFVQRGIRRHSQRPGAKVRSRQGVPMASEAFANSDMAWAKSSPEVWCPARS